MLEKELAQATKMAEQARGRIEKLRKKLLVESHKTQARLKRELGAARKRSRLAGKKLKSARATLRKQATADNQAKVDALVKQAQEFAESLPQMAKAAYEAAEKYVTVKASALLEDRKAQAATQAIAKVEKIAARPKKKRRVKRKAAAGGAAKPAAAAKKKATPRKKAAPRTKASAGKKVAARKKAPVKSKAKAAPRRKPAAKRKAAPRKAGR